MGDPHDTPQEGTTMHHTRQQLLARIGHLAFVEEPADPQGGDTQESPEDSSPNADGDNEESPEDDEDEPFDKERALRKIQKLNSESRNLRDRTQEAERKAANSDELTKTNEAQAAQIMRLEVALKHGLPAGLVGRLNGTTEEEILADAEELMGLFVAKQPPSQSPKAKAGARTPGSAEDGVDIDKLALSQLTQ